MRSFWGKCAYIVILQFVFVAAALANTLTVGEQDEVFAETDRYRVRFVEIEISVFSRQCLRRWIPDLETLRCEVEAWQKHRNKVASRVDWRFTTEDARIKLKRLYPKTQH